MVFVLIVVVVDDVVLLFSVAVVCCCCCFLAERLHVWLYENNLSNVVVMVTRGRAYIL